MESPSVKATYKYIHYKMLVYIEMCIYLNNKSNDFILEYILCYIVYFIETYVVLNKTLILAQL